MTKRFKSPLQKIAQTFEKLDLSKVETVTPFCIPPWQERPVVYIPEDRDKAAELAKNHAGLAVFTDASSRNGLVGIGIAWAPDPNLVHSRTIGSDQDLNTYYAELFAIHEAIMGVKCTLDRLPIQPAALTIFSDCQAALRSLGRPAQQSGQSLIRKIANEINEISKRHWIALQWVPGHAKVKGNEMANDMARLATRKGETLPPQTIRLRTTVFKDSLRVIKSHRSFDTRFGRATREMDKALPGKHTRTLYDRLNREEASILSQLRTANCRLNAYLARIGVVESNICSCGREAETVYHYLFRCNKWATFRDNMNRVAGDRAGDLSYFLGGWSGKKSVNGNYIDGDMQRWKPNMDAIKATIAFAKATCRLSAESD